MDGASILFEILSGGQIRSVYQPIVSLSDGSVLGYEALSRIALPGCQMAIEQLFEMATRRHMLWKLEKLCRTQALKGACGKPAGSKIFLNVDTNTIYEPGFSTGFTRETLAGLQLNPDDIIFEITEKSAVKSLPAFQAAVEHYQRQGFQVAIDDFGTGHSGFSRVCSFAPNYLKIDLSLVRGIDVDTRKSTAVQGLVKFCKASRIKVIAEGIETREELMTLIRLGVEYGQGYYLARPAREFSPLWTELPGQIRQLAQREHARVEAAVFGTVGGLCSKAAQVSPETPAPVVYERMKADPALTELCVVSRTGEVRGLLTRSYLLGRFSGQYGYGLCCRHCIGDLARQDYMAVDCGKRVDEVAEQAMERPVSAVYDAVVVTRDGKYLGLVTVRDLLTAAIRVRVQNAADANPLTGLLGNHAIQRQIAAVLRQPEPHAILYLDIDNFKAYNDAYGFANGDRMIQTLVQAMRRSCAGEDFLGHVGGDDFVVVLRGPERVSALCARIIETFSEMVQPLYSQSDRARGYIISRDRSGQVERFPLATLSIAAVTHPAGRFAGECELSKAIAEAKKQCKQTRGNAVVVL